MARKSQFRNQNAQIKELLSNVSGAIQSCDWNEAERLYRIICDKASLCAADAENNNNNNEGK
jgi:hypothetical protein